MMQTGKRIVDITAEDIQLLVQVGISKAYIRKALPEHLERQVDRLIGAPSSTGGGLSDTEIAILRRGGARGLSDIPDDRQRLQQNLEGLIKECRAFVTEAYDIAAVASMLGFSLQKVANKAREIPPSLAAFELDPGKLKFPQWQFNQSGLIPHVSDLLATASPKVNAFVLARFMVTPHVDLDLGTGRMSPRTWLVRGLDPEPVLSAVKAMGAD